MSVFLVELVWFGQLKLACGSTMKEAEHQHEIIAQHVHLQEILMVEKKKVIGAKEAEEEGRIF